MVDISVTETPNNLCDIAGRYWVVFRKTKRPLSMKLCQIIVSFYWISFQTDHQAILKSRKPSGQELPLGGQNETGKVGYKGKNEKKKGNTSKQRWLDRPSRPGGFVKTQIRALNWDKAQLMHIHEFGLVNFVLCKSMTASDFVLC